MRKTLRLPLTNNYNTRVSAVGSLPTSAAIAGVAVAGVAIAGTSAQSTSKDARFINCFKRSVTDEASGETRRYLIKRCGFAAHSTIRAGHIGNAIRVWSGQGTGTKVITAFGNQDSSIYDDGTRLTTNNSDTTIITGKATGITETVLSGTPTLAISSSDGTGWYYQNAGTVTKITDAQFPGNNSKTLAGTFAHMDGFAFILDTNGDLWNSDLNSITSWTATGYIPAGIYPDKGVAAIRWKRFIIAFGAQSMEFFRNAGNSSGSPLSRVEELAQKVGAISADAISEIGDNVFFVGPAPEGGLSLFQFDGSLSRVSNPEIDALMLLMGNGNISVTTFRDVGLSFVLVNGGGLTYAYCVEEKFWFQMTGSSEVLWTKCAGLSVASAQATYAISSLSSSGKLFNINPLSRGYVDNGSAFTAVAQLQTLDPGAGAFCAYEDLNLAADTESGTSTLTVSKSDDDYGSFTTLGTVDLTSSVKRITRMGGTKLPRAYKFEHSDNTPFRIQEARLTVNVGAR